MTKLSTSYKLRKANDRGHSNHGWLDARFTFSFADYYDSEYMSFRTLRVMNNDRIEPGMGFGKHSHRDMEIISYIVEGELEHKDSMGSGSVVKAGNVQKITAGTGIFHSEFNPSKENQTFMYQIWIEPDQKGLEPSYQELSLNDVKEKNGLTLFASNDKNDNVIHVNQDVRIYIGQFEDGTVIDYTTQNDRGIWIQMIDGELSVHDVHLSIGDGLAIEKVESIQLKSTNKSQFLLFDIK